MAGYATDCAIAFGLIVSKRSLWEKKPERKRKNLIRLGVDADHAYAWSRTRKGGWRIAQSPILNTTITIKRLKQKGYIPMLEIYTKLNPPICEPPYTRPAWFILTKEGSGGVRGAPHRLQAVRPSTRLCVRAFGL